MATYYTRGFENLATLFGKTQLIKFLLDRDMDVNALDMDENTLIHLVVWSDKREAALLL